MEQIENGGANKTTGRVASVYLIDLSQIEGVESLCAQAAGMLAQGAGYENTWTFFWKILHAPAATRSTLIFYNIAAFAKKFKEDAQLLRGMCDNCKNPDLTILFDHFERMKRGSLMEPFEQIFFTPPGTWGYRGDPHLWDDLKAYFINKPLPENEIEWRRQIHAAVKALTEHTLTKGESCFYCKKYNTGGMSGGMVNINWWLRNGIPRLIGRYRMIGSYR